MQIISNKTPEFNRIINQSKKPILVNFYANWSEPCQDYIKEMSELHKELNSKLGILWLNVDDNPLLVLKYSILKLPTLLVFENGRMTMRLNEKTNLTEVKETIYACVG